MLEPKKNRLDYGELLAPPSDYKLDFAVGTTYSLDFNLLILLPAALFHSRLLDRTAEDIRPDLLDALAQAADKIRIFCQQDRIKVPDQYHPLMLFWEKGIIQLRLDSYDKSFHPKIWLVRFTTEHKPARYRLVITSRNLTDTHDWDLAFSTEGDVGSREENRNRPLVDFLNFLQSYTNTDIPALFIQELLRVRFELPHNFRDMNFYPMGFSSAEANYQNPLLQRRWENLAVISPFIDSSTIKLLSQKSNNNLQILSRQEELDMIPPELLQTIGSNKLWQFSQDFANAGLIADLNDDSSQNAGLQDLHAKLFICTKGNFHHWFLGSANATTAARERNIEFLVELKSDSPRHSPQSIVSQLTKAEKNQLPLFEPYWIPAEPQSKTEEESAALRRLIYEIAGAGFEGMAQPRNTEQDKKLYDLKVSADFEGLIAPPKTTVTLRPIAVCRDEALPLKCGIKNEHVFPGLSESDLSPYLAITVCCGALTKEFLGKMKIELPETRFASIYRLLLDSQDKFLAYLAFLLGNEDANIKLKLLTHERQKSDGIESKSRIKKFTPVYEDLLLTLSRKPERLEAVAKMIELFERETTEKTRQIIPQGFLELWERFSRFRQTNHHNAASN